MLYPNIRYKYQHGDTYKYPLATSWESLILELPESPYTYDDKGKKKQRVRHRKS